MSEEQNKKVKSFNWILQVLQKWGLNETVAKIAAGAIIGALVAAGLLSCNSITTAQIGTAHALYHQVTNEPCIFTVDSTEK